VTEAFRISHVDGSAALATVTKRLLDQLPTWFGIPEANAGYVASATELPGLVAVTDTEPVGVLLHRRHFPESAEIHLLAVAPHWHRHGVGTAIVDMLVADLVADSCAVLQVKTLGPSHPDAGYAATRAFYHAIGFVPVEETTALWPDNPCLIMVKWLRPLAERR
jgi:GNAT superfamily N-acetyltransferase